MPIWDGIQIALACIMMISGTSMRPPESLSPQATAASRSGAEEPQGAVSPANGTDGPRPEHHQADQLPARVHQESSALHEGQLRHTMRMPQSAFAAQMLHQWSGEDDHGVYLLRERAYRQPLPQPQSHNETH